VAHGSVRGVRVPQRKPKIVDDDANNNLRCDQAAEEHSPRRDAALDAYKAPGNADFRARERPCIEGPTEEEILPGEGSVFWRNVDGAMTMAVADAHQEQNPLCQIKEHNRLPSHRVASLGWGSYNSCGEKVGIPGEWPDWYDTGVCASSVERKRYKAHDGGADNYDRTTSNIWGRHIQING